jgi:hypothetical protein
MAFNKLVRYEANGTAHYGDLQEIVDNEFVVRPRTGSPFEVLRTTKEPVVRVKQVGRLQPKPLRVAHKPIRNQCSYSVLLKARQQLSALG